MGLVNDAPKWASAENTITQVVSAFAGAKAMGCDCGAGLGLASIVAKSILSIEMPRTERGIDRCGCCRMHLRIEENMLNNCSFERLKCDIPESIMN